MNPEIIEAGEHRVQVFDLREEPHRLRSDEWRRSKRDPAKSRGIVLHQWDTPVGTTALNRRLYGEPGALARRALGCPAHISVGVTQLGGVPVVSLAHPLDRYGFHGDAANAGYIGFEVMGFFPFLEEHRTMHHTKITPALRAAVRVGLKAALDLLDQWTGSQGPWELITHRQGCNSKGDHVRCCGEAVVQMACEALPELEGRLIAVPGLVLDPQWSQPWPEAWKRHLPEEKSQVTPEAS